MFGQCLRSWLWPSSRYLGGRLHSSHAPWRLNLEKLSLQVVSFLDQKNSFLKVLDHVVVMFLSIRDLSKAWRSSNVSLNDKT